MTGIRSQIEKLASDEVCNAWDAMDSAAQRLLTAQPHQVTLAAEHLESARIRMRAAIQVALYAKDVAHPRALDEATHDR